MPEKCGVVGVKMERGGEVEVEVEEDGEALGWETILAPLPVSPDCKLSPARHLPHGEYSNTSQSKQQFAFDSHIGGQIFSLPYLKTRNDRPPQFFEVSRPKWEPAKGARQTYRRG